MVNNVIRIAIISVLVVLSFSSCKKNDPDLNVDPIPESGFFVVCEGNFNWGNSVITRYVEMNDILIQNYFEQVNGYSLGDVAQSITETEKYYLIVVNNSAKIEIVKKSDFSSVATIEGLGSPRYCQILNDSLAYVSDLWNDKINIINYINGTIIDQIALIGWSEQMVKSADSVYVSLYNSNSIAIINSLDHEHIASIEIDLPPVAMEIDKNGNLWVLASEFGGSSKLYRINSSNRVIEDEWEFDSNNNLVQIDIPEDGNYIYMASINGDIYKFPIVGTYIGVPLFSIEVDGLYGLNVNQAGDIYICEAYDFVQNGRISKYNESGFEQYNIESGINPNAIIFR